MVWYISGLIIVLIIHGCIAVKFSSIAEEKGYYGTSYFWLCFLLGTIGYCVVAALPDLILHSKVDNLRKLNQDIGKTEQTSTNINKSACTPVAPQKTSAGNWICKNCGTSNSLNYGQCKKCGQFKS